MKKIIAVFLAVSMLAGFGITLKPGQEIVAAAAAPTFKDISGHWAKESIEAAVKAGVLNGYPDQTFKPQNPITRAELLKVIALTNKIAPAASSAGRPWYSVYQTALLDNKIYAAGDFTGDINKPVTRVEMAKLAIRGANADYRGVKLTAEELMFRAVNAGLLSRTGTKADTIDPDGTTTRAQAAVIVTRLLKLANGGKLTTDQGASSAAEIAWHRHNMITMFDQNDLVSFPHVEKIRSNYQVTIDKLIVLDPSDKTGYYAEYLDGATYYLGGTTSSGSKGYIFAYKLIGKSLLNSEGVENIEGSFYMYISGDSGVAYLDKKYRYTDKSLQERQGLFTNATLLNLKQAGVEGHNYHFAFVDKNYIKNQIKELGGVSIHLEKFGMGFGDKKSQIYLTELKDIWYK
ncbi:S-layer homology domain-containing protein [Paenibacillus algorifonticola]|uniref:S-layer homology domain-containing protein n=1 Tax=Paenibacillus algorifonticola TaxID=684063 RepID=UPI003D2C87D3